MTNIFDNAMNTVFCNMNYLEDRHIPSKLIGRDKEINSIVSAYSPILRYENPHNLFLFGQPGTGKSVTNEYVIRELREQIKKQKLKIDVKHFRVSCRDANTNTAVLRELIDKAELGKRPPKRGFSFNEYFNCFTKIFSDDSHRLLIIELDEIDQLRGDDDLLYLFSRAYENFPQNTKINIVGISNDFNYKSRISTAVLSSLDVKNIFFDPYEKDQLIQILEDRRPAFKDGVVSDAVIKNCCSYLDYEHGDARRAINTLKKAGRIADEKGESKILPRYAVDANGEEEGRSQFEVIDNLMYEQKKVLLAVVELFIRKHHKHDPHPIRSDQVYSAYEILAHDLDGSPLDGDNFLRTLKELQAYQLIHLQKDRRGRKNIYDVELEENINENKNSLKRLLQKLLNNH